VEASRRERKRTTKMRKGRMLKETRMAARPKRMRTRTGTSTRMMETKRFYARSPEQPRMVRSLE